MKIWMGEYLDGPTGDVNAKLSNVGHVQRLYHVPFKDSKPSAL